MITSRGGSILCAMVFGVVVSKADPFINLGFESANISGISSFRLTSYDISLGPQSDLIPGWYGKPSASVGITDSRSWNEFWSIPYPYLLVSESFAKEVGFPIVGSFAFAIKSRSGNNGEFGFAQTGDIPYGATEFRFLFRGSVPMVRVTGTSEDVLIPFPGGIERIGPPLEISRSEDFTTFDHYHSASYISYDISKFAGQKLEVSITGNTRSFPVAFESGGAPLDLYVDDFQFVVVPEPSTKALLGVSIAAGLFWLRSRVRAATPSRRDRSADGFTS